MNKNDMLVPQSERLDLNYAEMKVLLRILEGYEGNKCEFYDSLLKKVKNPTQIYYSRAKSDAAATATKVRSDKAKKKINEAVKSLKLDLKREHIKKISYYAIAKKSGSHINTVKKYITLDEMNVI